MSSSRSSSSAASSASVRMKDVVRALYPPRLVSGIGSSGARSDSFSFGGGAAAPGSGSGGGVERSHHGAGAAGAAADGGHRHRFSELLLEHGERHLQDWACAASSSAVAAVVDDDAGGAGGGGSGGAPGPGGAGARPLRRRSRSGGATPAAVSTAASAMRRSASLSAPSRSERRCPADRPLSLPPSASMGCIRGRMRLCSRSVVFEPDDVHRGIVRCPFGRMERAPFEITADGAFATGAAAAANGAGGARRGAAENGGGGGDGAAAAAVAFRCDRHVVMKAGNVIAPFDGVEIPTEFRFRFLHSSPRQFLELSSTLFDMTARGGKGKGQGTIGGGGDTVVPLSPSAAESKLDDLLRPVLDRPFDPSNLLDVRERPRTSNLRCSLLRPLLSRQGCSIVTDRRIYFQPVGGVCDGGTVAAKAVSWELGDVAASARRYHGLRDCALEIYLRSSGSSVLLAFETKRERERVMSLLPRNVPCHTDRRFVVEAAKAWRAGDISNFEYLLALNSAAGRTFHDLSRYPVFPWVVSDYESRSLDLNAESTYRDLSKPVGALDPDRLAYFQARYDSMRDMGHEHDHNHHGHHPSGASSGGAGSGGHGHGHGHGAFLYGTHYSAPGYVLYYLVRQMPEHMLCLQNGKFDAADRMFHDVGRTYRSALTNHADVKELIPEFYDPRPGGYDFLINARNLRLGSTQTGERVHDVGLPPWARSGRDFLKKNRRALESDLCASRLPRWIDLVFGCRSRGDGAREARNVFHPASYAGPAEYDALTTDEERNRAELQATEFGIVPDLLFCGPHPSRAGTAAASSTENGASEEDEFSFVAPDSGRAAPPPDIEGGGALLDCNGPLLSAGGSQDAASGAAPGGSDGGSGGGVGGARSAGGQRGGGDQPWEILDAPMNRGTSFEEAEGAKAAAPGGGTANAAAGTDQADGAARDEREEAPPPAARTAAPGAAAAPGWATPVGNGFGGGAATPGDNDDDLVTPRHGSSSSMSWTNLPRSGSGRKGAGQRDGVAGLGSRTRTFSSEDGFGFETMSVASPPRRSADRRPDQGAAAAAASSDAAAPAPSHPGWERIPLAAKRVHGDRVSGINLLLQAEAGDGGEAGAARGAQRDGRSYLTTVSLDGGLVVHTLPFLDGSDESNGRDGRSPGGRRSFTAAKAVSSTLAGRFSYLSGSGASRRPPPPPAPAVELRELRRHSSSDPLSCLSLASDGAGGHVAFAGGHDDVVAAYGIGSACALASAYSHRDAVTGIDLLPRSRGRDRDGPATANGAAGGGARAASSSSRGRGGGTHTMVTGSWDATVKVWSASVEPGEAVSIDREPAAELFDADAPVACVAATRVLWGGDAVAICAGCSDGTVVAWLCRDDGGKEVIYKEEPKRGGGPCSAVAWTPSGSVLFAGFGTGRVVSYSLEGPTLRPLSRLSVGSPVQCLAVCEDNLLVGCSDGGLRLVPVGGGGMFDSNPRLWRAVNGPGAPGLSSVAVGRLRAGAAACSGRGRTICATGADDGTVALFELKEG